MVQTKVGNILPCSEFFVGFEDWGVVGGDKFYNFLKKNLQRVRFYIAFLCQTYKPKRMAAITSLGVEKGFQVSFVMPKMP